MEVEEIFLLILSNILSGRLEDKIEGHKVDTIKMTSGKFSGGSSPYSVMKAH